ncbi:hypothetical protein BD31_I1615 [Candidatus Nitrosopumilus salaria BD31]|uniref:DUF4037 domain-containing protein n=1 Tax=Candidatus Nitrosopumilus salarius BD31 TaxID=859350 RepID=I3D362_9ARCH|nr:hypothetical protein [Candidatus Nitrosopumilus salaria]EIJ66155.1 hypothetical protein BD31_I1615 [Candidatus Nitrosopumilus salaria BD31]
MNIKKFVEDEGLSEFPIGLTGCRVSDFYFDSCDYDIVVFDEKSELEKIVKFENDFVMIHHASLSETRSKKLLQYDALKIIQDESWDLRMLLSKINEKRNLLFLDFAKNCLIESIFCCQKTKESIQTSDVFAPCWQKCATYYLADAISAISHQRSSPSHMLDSLRKLKKTPINENISVVTQTVGIERSIPTLLERMLKSTIGFSDLIEKNNHSQIIQQKHDFFVKNSMLSDCYFYLGYINKENFLKIKDNLSRRQDLIYLLKIAFDVESDENLLEQQSETVQKSANSVLEIISSA